MSVLKAKRKVSKAQFVQTAYELYSLTQEFSLRLSARYQRVLGNKSIDAASCLIDQVAAANSIKITDKQTFELRKRHLLEARGALRALSIQITCVYNVVRKNPEGAFRTQKGAYKTPSQAKKLVDNLAQQVGEKIAEEYKLLEGVMRFDKGKFGELTEKSKIQEEGREAATQDCTLEQLIAHEDDLAEEMITDFSSMWADLPENSALHDLSLLGT